MRLLRLKVEQLRRFRQPVEIRDLDPGINLFTGPNESGKSTLVRAIRAAFFERYKSSSVEDLQPWGDSAAAPTVELEFESQGKRWKLVKSFLKRKRCDVSVDGVGFSGEEAEDKLADLLGFEFPGRGASRPEHWGIPGLLWIEQGAGQEIHKPVEHAGSHLKSVLGASLGEVTSTAGDELIARITRERARLLTATGRPTGDFAAALEAHERLAREHADLQGRIRQYRQQVDRLGQLREEQARDESERIWEVYRQQARAADLRLAEVVSWQREQERDQQAL
ncbi:MAG TPA: ATP-binding protein, partial [Thauera aminoaromatica]|nr:ATP-binding protein [Thauera aminoaromatica]